MSFGNQYIEKYGHKAIQTYARSLRHSDEKEPSVKAPHSSKLKHSDSSSKISCLSRSKVSSTNVRKPSPKPAINHEKKAHPNAHLSTVQLFLQPTKKKLVISDLNTPKGTPNKARTAKNNPKILTNTNVNVYVQAMNRSKSKESTPCKQKYRSKRQKSRPKPSEIIPNIKSLLGQVQRKSENNEVKTIRKCIQSLQSLQFLLEKEAKKKAKLQHKVRKMRELIGCSRSRDSLGNQHSDYVCSLEAQLKSYRHQQQSLLRIIESLSGNRHQYKQASPESNQASSEQEDDAEPI